VAEIVIYRRLRTGLWAELGRACVGGVMDDSNEGLCQHLRELRPWMFHDARKEASAMLAKLRAF
jgi:hypothetical protein